ncbi:MAG: SDR family oxidoreductase [Desulfobacterales bacterium]|nr:SDR family oxidoreductase [Desulfobacterales bacterium]
MEKSIFITGAASGIGKETALLFARKGWFVGAVDVSEAALKQLGEQIGGGNVLLKVADVTRPESLRQAAAAVGQRTGGRLDILFNNAGTLAMGHHQTIALEKQRGIVEVNLLGVLNGIAVCLDLLKGTAGARIINMSSASALYGTPELAVYSATKAAVKALTEALNIEFEPLGIHVCDIMAPFVRTPMIVQAAVAATSVKRLGIHLRPQEVAHVVWQAAHGKKLHWEVGFMMRLLRWAVMLFPFAQRPMVKMLGFSSAAGKGGAH